MMKTRHLAALLAAIPSAATMAATLPIGSMALLALGFRSLSMSATSVGPVRAMVRSLNLSEVTPYVLGMLDYDVSTIREYLRSFAHDRSIALG